MKIPVLAACALMVSTFAAEAGIQVSVSDDSRQAQRLAAYMERVGPRYLAPNQDLKIDIVDYRRAERDPFASNRYGFGPYWGGSWGPGFGRPYWRDPFFTSGTFDRPARIKLRYTLTENGKRVASDTRTISAWTDGAGFRQGSWDGETAERDAVRRFLRGVARDRD